MCPLNDTVNEKEHAAALQHCGTAVQHNVLLMVLIAYEGSSNYPLVSQEGK